MTRELPFFRSPLFKLEVGSIEATITDNGSFFLLNLLAAFHKTITSSKRYAIFMGTSQKKELDVSSTEKELTPDQTLGLVSLSLMQKLSQKDPSFSWLEEDKIEKVNLKNLRDRLELTQLAINTGAPLTTSEVTALIGAKPGKSKLERAGLLATKIARNVWKISKISQGNSFYRN